MNAYLSINIVITDLSGSNSFKVLRSFLERLSLGSLAF